MLCLLRTIGVSAAKRDQIENFIKNFFISEIDVNLIISRIFIISKKNFFTIWSLFAALTPNCEIIVYMYIKKFHATNLLRSSVDSFSNKEIRCITRCDQLYGMGFVDESWRFSRLVICFFANE